MGTSNVELVEMATALVKGSLRIIDEGHWANGHYHKTEECAFCKYKKCRSCYLPLRNEHEKDCPVLKAKEIIKRYF